MSWTLKTAIGGCLLLTAAMSSLNAAQARSTAVPGTGIHAVREPTEVHATVPNIAWKDCGSQLQCARVQVPLDFEQPDGAQISLRLERRLADDQAHRIGSLFVNPGGPGGSAAQFVPAAARLLGAVVRQRFDVIGVDPRGVAGSTRVVCRAQAGDPPLPPAPREAFPRGVSQTSGWFAYDEAVRQLCAKRGSAVLNHMTTADTARDMDLIRQAVGDPMLSYYGISYGTMLGSTYAAMFPSRVRAVIVDGVLDPVSWTTGRFGTGDRLTVSSRLRSGYGAWDALTSAFAECDRVGTSHCPQAGIIGHEWDKIAAKLRQGAVRLGGGRVTYADVVGQLLGGLYDASVYPDIMTFIDQVYRLMFASSSTTSATASQAWDDLKAAVARSGGTDPRYGPGVVTPASRTGISPTFQGVLCSDSVNPTDEHAAIHSSRVANRQGPGFGALWAWASSSCINWPGSSADAFQGPWRTKTAHPLLITGNAHDPATPISGARAVNKLFAGSVLITVDTWGHGALGHSDCVVKKWDDYLLSGRLPAPGLVCQPNAPLFPG